MNFRISRDSILFRKGVDLFATAYEYWKEMQKDKRFRAPAVFHITNEEGMCIIFTRSEYRDELMAVVDRINYQDRGNEENIYYFTKDDDH